MTGGDVWLACRLCIIIVYITRSWNQSFQTPRDRVRGCVAWHLVNFQQKESFFFSKLLFFGETTVKIDHLWMIVVQCVYVFVWVNFKSFLWMCDDFNIIVVSFGCCWQFFLMRHKQMCRMWIICLIDYRKLRRVWLTGIRGLLDSLFTAGGWRQPLGSSWRLAAWAEDRKEEFMAECTDFQASGKSDQL